MAMFRTIRTTDYEEGWILTEGIGGFLFYLVMLGVVVGMLYAMFSGGKQTQMQQGLANMRMQIQSMYAGSSTYTGLTTAVALKGGVIPRKLVVGGTKAQTPWGGAITITGQTTGTFTIALAGIPQEDCAKLAAYGHDMWVGVDVNGTKFDPTSTVSSIITACATTNTITYTSR